MGKHSNSKHSDVQFGATHPSCMWSVFHVLDYHVWNSIKRIVRHKKHSKERQPGCYQKTNKVSFEHDRFSVQKLSDPGVEQLQEGERDIKAIQRSISNGQTKPIITEEEIDILSSGFLPMKCNKNVETSVFRSEDSSPLKTQKKSVVKTKTYGKSDTLDKDYLAKECDEVIGRFLSKKYVSAEQKADMQHAYDLKLYGLNKRLFHKILNPTEFRPQRNLSSKVRLNESASFPVPRSVRGKSIRTSSLKHKQSEVWSFRKGGMSDSKPMFSGSKSAKDIYENPGPQKNVDSMVNVIDQVPISRGLPKGKVNQGWNQVVIHRYKQMKHRIKRVLMENGNDSKYKSTGRMNNKISSPVKSMDGITNGQEIEENSQRSSEFSSFEELSEKHAGASEHDFSGKSKLSHSNSLNLTSEDKVSPKVYKRSLSMPNLDPMCISMSELPHETPYSELPNTTVLDHSMSDGGSDKKAITVTEAAAIIAEDSNYDDLSQMSELSDDIVIELEQRNNSKEHYTGLTVNFNDELYQSSLNSTSPSSFPSDETSPEGLASEETHSAAHQLEPLVEVEKSSTNSMSSLYNILAGYNGKDPNKNIIHYITNMDKNDSDFSYIKDILKLPGITEKDDFGSWQSDGQLSNLSLLKELEVYEHKGLQCFGDNLDEHFDNQIIFDLVHEILVNIYGKCFTYFPKALFCNGIRPLPTGHRLIEEVLKRVNWYLSLMPELDQSLESVVSRDMYKENNWMKLQLENERVALELEDMIFDDLIDEIIYSDEMLH